MAINSLARRWWSLLLPINCLGCRAESDWLCPDCRGSLAIQRSELCFCGRAATDGLCSKHRRELGLDGLTTLFPYASPLVRELVQQLKYHGHTDIVPFLADHYRRQALARLPRGDWTITPVPLAKKRLATRGFNQSALLARSLAEPVYDYRELLVKKRDTLPQVELKKVARQKNLTRAFGLKPSLEPPEQVILVDDVITTGSTLREAAKVLHRKGAKRVWAFTFAHG